MTIIADLFRSKSLSPVEYLKAYLSRIDRYDPLINAFIDVDWEGATAAARAAEREIVSGRHRGFLHGVPVAIKDIFDIEGQRTSGHSKIRLDHIAERDSFAVRRLREAGAVVVGKTALHEFATGGPSFDLPWPPARNPWDIKRHPGGSSSGSGAAVAARLVPVALGTDTGGSVRNPATTCGVTGIKPTFGAVSRTGVFPLSPSLDHVGVITVGVEDNAIALEPLLAKDPEEPESVTHPSRDLHNGMNDGIRGLRLGILEQFGVQADPQIRGALSDAIEVFKGLRADLVPVKLSPLERYVDCGRLILQAESFAIHETWLDTRPDDYGKRGRTRLGAGRALSAANYNKALDTRTELRREFADATATLDAVLCVSSLELPCAIEDEAEINRSYDRQARTPFNLLGLPALSIPIGFSKEGLPIGLQIAGAAFSEATIYRIARSYEAATGWHRRYPDLDALLVADSREGKI
ncbi:amidase [Bradyrhizobium sp. 41S5]|uniref:amidase n=1 Tax=Bradyrhizobium sp. 41S5 TaxID=1404443 RepID=UPI00156B9256|nr:amidase [Bradyrhizobium sp. 41S5]UFX42745.1 amidase [Bradyrhizobium sp. 41S5]